MRAVTHQAEGPGAAPKSTPETRSAQRAATAPLTAAGLIALQGLAGNAAAGLAVQRQSRPRGRRAAPTRTPFGDFFVVPRHRDEEERAGVPLVTPEELFERQMTWSLLNSPVREPGYSVGSVTIEERDRQGASHAGFRQLVLQACAELLRGNRGARLLHDLVQGGMGVIIRPRADVESAGRNATTETTPAGLESARAGGAHGPFGAGSTIELDPDFSTEQLQVYGPGGLPIASPGFITLGHELIHAWHNASAHNLSTRTSPGHFQGDAEENATIEGTGGTAPQPITENDLRHEHHLPARHGHDEYMPPPSEIPGSMSGGPSLHGATGR